MTEEMRLKALARCGLMFTPPEPEFDRIIRIAAHALSASGVKLTLADEENVFIKSASGDLERAFPARVVPAIECLTPYVIFSGAPIIVSEVRSHPIARHVKGLCDIAKAVMAVPLHDADRFCLGALTVIDSKTRQWSEREVQALTDLSDVITREIAFRSLEQKERKKREEKIVQAEASGDVLCVMDSQLKLREVGARATEVWGCAPEALVGRHISSLLIPSDAARTVARLMRIKEDRLPANFQTQCIQPSGPTREVFWMAIWSESDQSFYAITRSAPHTTARIPVNHKRILIVEDYREIALLIRTALQASGFSWVDTASGPGRALELMNRYQYDLVVSDLKMQPMNGVELFSAVRERFPGKKVPFLVISGYANLDVLDQMKKIGVDAFIAKPFKTADLVKHVRRLLNMPSLSAA